MHRILAAILLALLIASCDRPQENGTAPRRDRVSAIPAPADNPPLEIQPAANKRQFSLEGGGSATIALVQSPQLASPPPLIYLYPDSPALRGLFQPGLALLAAAPAETDFGATAAETLDAFLQQQPTAQGKRYLIARNLEGLRFACQCANRFDGIILSWTDQPPAAAVLKTLPFKKLSHIPCCIGLGILDENQTALKAIYGNLDSSLPHAPEFMPPPLLVHPGLPPAILNIVFEQFSAETGHGKSIHWTCTSLADADVPPFRILQFERPGAPATLDAAFKSRADLVTYHLKTDNVRLLAIQRHVPIHPQEIVIDGQKLVLPPCPGRREQHLQCLDGTWRMIPPPPQDPLAKAPHREGPIRDLLRHPFTIVLPTADNADAWKTAAIALAEAWHKRTGRRPAITTDQALIQHSTDTHLLICGSPEENLAASILLGDNPSLLKSIYANIPDEQRDPDHLCSLTLQPAGELAPQRLALILIANSPALIPDACPILLTPAQLNADFLLYRPDHAAPPVSGFLDHNWQ